MPEISNIPKDLLIVINHFYLSSKMINQTKEELSTAWINPISDEDFQSLNKLYLERREGYGQLENKLTKIKAAIEQHPESLNLKTNFETFMKEFSEEMNVAELNVIESAKNFIAKNKGWRQRLTFSNAPIEARQEFIRAHMRANSELNYFLKKLDDSIAVLEEPKNYAQSNDSIIPAPRPEPEATMSSLAVNSDQAQEHIEPTPTAAIIPTTVEQNAVASVPTPAIEIPIEASTPSNQSDEQSELISESSPNPQPQSTINNPINVSREVENKPNPVEIEREEPERTEGTQEVDNSTTDIYTEPDSDDPHAKLQNEPVLVQTRSIGTPQNSLDDEFMASERKNAQDRVKSEAALDAVRINRAQEEANKAIQRAAREQQVARLHTEREDEAQKELREREQELAAANVHAATPPTTSTSASVAIRNRSVADEKEKNAVKNAAIGAGFSVPDQNDTASSTSSKISPNINPNINIDNYFRQFKAEAFPESNDTNPEVDIREWFSKVTPFINSLREKSKPKLDEDILDQIQDGIIEEIRKFSAQNTVVSHSPAPVAIITQKNVEHEPTPQEPAEETRTMSEQTNLQNEDEKKVSVPELNAAIQAEEMVTEQKKLRKEEAKKREQNKNKERYDAKRAKERNNQNSPAESNPLSQQSVVDESPTTTEVIPSSEPTENKLSQIVDQLKIAKTNWDILMGQDLKSEEEIKRQASKIIELVQQYTHIDTNHSPAFSNNNKEFSNLHKRVRRERDQALGALAQQEAAAKQAVPTEQEVQIVANAGGNIVGGNGAGPSLEEDEELTQDENENAAAYSPTAEQHEEQSDNKEDIDYIAAMFEREAKAEVKNDIGQPEPVEPVLNVNISAEPLTTGVTATSSTPPNNGNQTNTRPVFGYRADGASRYSREIVHPQIDNLSTQDLISGLEVMSNAGGTYQLQDDGTTRRATMNHPSPQSTEEQIKTAITVMNMIDNALIASHHIQIETEDPFVAEVANQYIMQLKANGKFIEYHIVALSGAPTQISDEVRSFINDPNVLNNPALAHFATPAPAMSAAPTTGNLYSPQPTFQSSSPPTNAQVGTQQEGVEKPNSLLNRTH